MRLKGTNGDNAGHFNILDHSPDVYIALTSISLFEYFLKKPMTYLFVSST